MKCLFKESLCHSFHDHICIEMDNQIQQWRLSFFFFFLLLILSFSYLHVDGTPQVPCYFIFGDSLADNGNNNNRHTVAKADYLPYGVNFQNIGPTGRFTNNRTMVDVITQLLGFDEFIPSFANAKGEEVLKGVNYASAAAGILDETGRRNQGDIISLNQQLSHHLMTISNIKLLLGSNSTAADEHLSKCLYTVGMGSNDYINNYLLPDIYNTSSTYNQEEFANLLVQQYTQQLKSLHSYGARKVAVFGLNLIGLAPGLVSRLGVLGASKATIASLRFTNKLQGLVDQLNNELPGAKFTYINIPGITLLITPKLVFLNTLGTCCEVVDVYYTCKRDRTACPNPNKYAFFDGYHPTDVVNEAMAGRAYQETLRISSSPYDIRSLAGMKTN